MERLSRSKRAPVAQVERARALLCVADGSSFAQAARVCGRASGDTVASWVRRFNLEGVNALVPRHGGGANARYSEEDRARIVAAARRSPDSRRDGAPTWSLQTLRRSLLRQQLPAPSTYTLWRILRAEGVQWSQSIVPDKSLNNGGPQRPDA